MHVAVRVVVQCRCLCSFFGVFVATTDVQALVVLLSRDKRVGACCGRTFPKGSGPVYWYQIFDYAVGHWFQKTAEHVLGTVLCCPGCFSLYRIDALRDCLSTYATSVTEAFDFLTKDMGEDRWLCTLMVMKVQSYFCSHRTHAHTCAHKQQSISHGFDVYPHVHAYQHEMCGTV